MVIRPPRSAVGSYTNCHSLYFFFLLNSRMVFFLLTLATPTIGPPVTGWSDDDLSLESPALLFVEFESWASEEDGV